MRRIKRRLEDKIQIPLIIAMLALLTAMVLLSGCSVLEATGGRTTVSAKGGPAALLNLFTDLKNQGALKTTPGGFTIRNNDPGFGAISNQDRGVSKDVDFYVRKPLSYINSRGKIKERQDWVLYQGPAEVYVPTGIIRIGEKKWKLEDKWLKVTGLESIHFESPFLQKVTLLLRSKKEGKIQEVEFETYGRKNGRTYERINTLFIKLPINYYRLEIFSYAGKGIFKKAKNYPTTRYIYMDTDPTDYRIGNTLVGWNERL
jgi:hypothetical protein